MKKYILTWNTTLLSRNKMLNNIIILLIHSQSCDIIFIPQQTTSIYLKGFYLNDLPIEYKRIDEHTIYVGDISNIDLLKLQMHIKLSTKMNLIDKIPQSSSASFKLYDSNMIKNQNISVNSENFYNKNSNLYIQYSVRFSLHPTNYGESLAIRLIKPQIFDLYKHLTYVINTKKYIFIGGLTGSGKTTLMYSLLNAFTGHIITLEDPVEYVLQNVVQTDVSLIGFEEGIKSALRQKPDLICIGEIRDIHSAQSCLRAVYTGHKLITTIHLSNPYFLYTRLLELGISLQEDITLLYIENRNVEIYDLKKN
jgi:type II secretory ATPase GspE/PulE/Tfp pilus assembly ATPase PilB-like protein